MKFSIVIPTYNEEHDIRATLDSLIQMDWPNYEVIVVDDSTDSTPKIVASYANQGVVLIRPAKREGRCGARNIGIMQSTGDVVVILNADTRLPVDFLKKIEPHYKNGADYVLVSSQVENMNDLFARYIECTGLALFYDRDSSYIEWTEGFSCRREIAIRAGLFPVGFAVPICAGEDGFFGSNLKKIGAQKKVDLNIVVTHVAPAAFKEYWYIRKGRGQGSPQIRRFLHHWSFPLIITWACLRIVKNVMTTLLVIPLIYKCATYCRYSPNKLKDLLPFCYSWIIEQAAFTYGEFASIRQIMRAEKKNKLKNSIAKNLV